MTTIVNVLLETGTAYHLRVHVLTSGCLVRFVLFILLVFGVISFFCFCLSFICVFCPMLPVLSKDDQANLFFKYETRQISCFLFCILSCGCDSEHTNNSVTKITFPVTNTISDIQTFARYKALHAVLSVIMKENCSFTCCGQQHTRALK